MGNHGIAKPLLLEAATDVARVALGALGEDHRLQDKLVLHLGGDYCIGMHVYVDTAPDLAMLSHFALSDECEWHQNDKLEGIFDITTGRLALEDDSIVGTDRALSDLDDKSVIAVPKGRYQVVIYPMDRVKMEEDDAISALYEDKVKQEAIEQMGFERHDKAVREQAALQQGCLVLMLLLIVSAVLLLVLPWAGKVVVLLLAGLLYKLHAYYYREQGDVAQLAAIQQSVDQELYCHFVVHLQSLD